MHSWMAAPTNDGTSYFGNALVHKNGFTVDEGRWVCVELHAKLNPDPATGAGAVLEVFKNDGTECTDFPAPASEKLDLRFRSTTTLAFNAFWPQNYITDPAQGTLTLDQMVVATQRIGCIR